MNQDEEQAASVEGILSGQRRCHTCYRWRSDTRENPLIVGIICKECDDAWDAMPGLRFWDFQRIHRKRLGLT